MAQRIQTFDPSHAAPYAQGALNASSANRGIPAMNSGVPPMANMDIPDSYTHPYENGQAGMQAKHAMQNHMQNVTTARPQAAANAMGAVRKQVTDMATPEEHAKQFQNAKMADVIYSTSGGGALMQLNSVIQSPERQQFIDSIATSRKMFSAESPELGQIMREANQYG
jgi:hypothetical protein